MVHGVGRAQDRCARARTVLREHRPDCRLVQVAHLPDPAVLRRRSGEGAYGIRTVTRSSWPTSSPILAQGIPALAARSRRQVGEVRRPRRGWGSGSTFELAGEPAELLARGHQRASRCIPHPYARPDRMCLTRRAQYALALPQCARQSARPRDAHRGWVRRSRSTARRCPQQVSARRVRRPPTRLASRLGETFVQLSVIQVRRLISHVLIGRRRLIALLWRVPAKPSLDAFALTSQ